MRLLRLVPIALLASAAIAACSSAAGPGWTYAPAPAATPVPSTAASASAPASAAPSAAPSGPAASGPAGSPGASAPAGETVTVVATTAAKFDTPTLTTAADKPFTLVFDNQDPSAPHNVVIVNPDGSKVSMGDTAFFTGPAQRTYQVPALAAGDYKFHCEVHPNMTGVLTVK